MPRIGSIAGRSLANAYARKASTLFPFSGANISATATASQLGSGTRVANTSTWTFLGGTVTFNGTGLPYHSYYNSESATIPTAQNYNYTWSYRGGSRVEGSSTPTNNGMIGIWLNGVAMYSPRDALGIPLGFSLPNGFQFNAAYASTIELGYTFGEDLAGGHALSTKQYHYHDGSFFNAWLTGIGHVSGNYGVTGTAETSVIKYLGSGLLHTDGHSKILGISADGYPVYGPYGYTIATDNTSGIKRMASGYSLNSTGNRSGTAASNTIVYPMGIFVEDYSYTASGDLDQHNGRYCVTPEYPQGTYAYFVTINADKKPAYPYIIGNTFFGPPAQLA